MHIPTLAEELEYLKERLQRADVVPLMKEFAPAVDALVRILCAFGKQLQEIAQSVAALPPSPGYEPYLIERGVDPILARAMSKILVRRGMRVARDSVRQKEVVDAIRFLSKPGRHKKSIANRVDILLTAWNETTVFETLSDDTGQDLSELLRSLKAVACGHEDADDHLVQAAASIAPRLKLSRGPKVRASSVAHQFFLETLHMQNTPRGYSLSYENGKFLDPEAEATRREFGLRKFDPRTAYLRLKTQRDIH